MFYIFHGEDEFSRQREVAGLRARLAGGDPAMADLNTNLLDGDRLTFGELRHTCDSMPFMAERRLVIVRGLLSRLASGQKRGGASGAPEEQDPGWRRTFRDELAAYLPKLPPTTRLIFDEPVTLSASHPILKLVEAQGKEGPGLAKEFSLPKGRELVHWIEEHAQASRGKISREAAEMLALLVGADLRLLDQEIDKLLLYANGERPASVDDVRRLVSRARETSVFDLVDCVGRGETDRALQLLHRLLEEGEHPLQILTMLARQIRILIQVRELQGQGLNPQEIAGQLKLHPYVAGKAADQAAKIDMARLEAAHRRLVETDWAIKTGKLEEVLALDLLVVGLGGLRGD